MDPTRWARVDAALERLLDGDESAPVGLTAEERQLLARLADAAGAATDGLETPAADHEPLAAALDEQLAELDGLGAGDRVGPFRLAQRIGAGGMGVVFLAERSEGGFDQRVALKLLARPRDDGAAIRLFERERELLARLEHPNIARLIDGGLTDRRRPWLAMEYIDGEPLVEHAARRRLSIAARLGLFLQACDALDHAHRRFVLHRDIKPANLLVAKNGRVKLVDFGLGRVLVEASGDGDETLARGRMTPTWASPEQARGEPVTTRSEVYQLGLVLYRLLTGRAPYDVDASTPWTIAQAIAEARIAPPSEAWRDPRAEADGFDRPAARLRRRLRGDLDNIVLKALAVEPGRRYAGVDELAEDLRRHLASEPVRARAATRRYRLSRFVQRNRAAVAGGGAFVLLLVASLVVFGFQSRALQIERDRAVENAARSERLVEAMAGMIRLSDAENAVEQLYSLGDLLDRYVDYVRTELDQDPLERARLLGILGQAMHGIDRWAPAREVISLALAETERLVGPSSKAVQDLRSLLAEATAFDGNLDQAVRLLDAVERSAVRREGPVSEAVADTVYLRGFLRAHHAIRGSRQYRQGLADLERALMLYRDMFEDPHAKIAKAMHALGFKLDDPQRRLEMVENGLSMTRELVGTEHPVYAMRLAELALVHDGDGNDAEAAMIGRRAYDIHARIQGETHPESMTMLSNLAGFHREAGNLERAVTLYRDLHQIRQQTLPEDHLLLAFTAHGLGNTLRMLGDHSESERWLREALRLCLLHESRNEAVTRENLARTLEAAGRLPAALEQQRRAVAAYRRHFGESSAAVNTARQRLESMQPGG